jgi:hypothetical protein
MALFHSVSQVLRGAFIRDTVIYRYRSLNVCFLSTSSSPNSSKVALDPNEFLPFPVSKVETLTHVTSSTLRRECKLFIFVN